VSIEERAREYFSDRNTLEKIDEIHRYLDLAVRETIPSVLDNFERSIRAIGDSYPDWTFKRTRVGRHSLVRSLELQVPKGIFRRGTRIDFGYSQKEIDHRNGLPQSPWVGLYMPEGTPEEFDDIAALLRDRFFEGLTDDYKSGYPIYEFVKDWPDTASSYTSLVPILVPAETEAMSEDIGGLFEELLKAVDRAV